MISWKWTKSWTNFYWLETNLCQSCIGNRPRFTYGACEQFNKHRESIQKFRETGNWKTWYRNELDKACFARDAAFSASKD